MVIAKQVQGKDFRRVLDYVHSKEGAYLIGGNMAGSEPTTLAAEFRVASGLRKTLNKRVYHVSLSTSPQEKLSDKQWRRFVDAYLKGMEFEGSQYVVYRHTDREHDHVHAIASRIRLTDGSVVPDSWQYRRSERLLRLLEPQFGLQPTTPSWERGKCAPKTGELRRQRRTGEASKRVKLQKLLEQSLKSAATWSEMLDQLQAEGVSVWLRREQGTVVGISYGLEGIGFKGRQLGKDFTASAVRKVLSGKQKTTEVQLISNECGLELNQLASGQEEVTLDESQENYRQRYEKLSTLVGSQLKDQTSKDGEKIDEAVAVLVLAQTKSLEEVYLILAQCERVRESKEMMETSKYRQWASDYIHNISNRARARIEQLGFSLLQVEL